MNDLQKVLVVDDGDRSPDRALSSDLAELGFSSVTTSLDATDDVLQVIARPSAIFLQMPSPARAERHAAFVALADRLAAKPGTAEIPVFMVDGSLSADPERVSAILRCQFGGEVASA